MNLYGMARKHARLPSTNDLLKQVNSTLTPRYFLHVYMMLFYESGIDPLAAMKIVGRNHYQSTANTYATPRRRRYSGLQLTWRRCLQIDRLAAPYQ